MQMQESTLASLRFVTARTRDCDGGVDEELSFTIWYQDLDGDSYGNSSISTYDCTEPQNYVADGGDCDDENVGVNPGIVRVCDGSDNNCDGGIDEDLPTTAWYADADEDRYGNDLLVQYSCSEVDGM